MLPADQPYLPGYTDFQPPYTYRIGCTYGSTKNKTLIDPAVTGRENFPLPDRLTDDFAVQRKCVRDIDVVRSRYTYENPPYIHHAPGYEGFVPRYHGRYGQNVRIAAMIGLSEMEKMDAANQRAVMAIKNRMGRVIEYDKEKARIDVELDTQFTMPMHEVRPEMMGVIKQIPVCEPFLPPPTYDTHPFFMSNQRPEIDEEKYVQYKFPKYSEGHPNIIPMAMVDLTNNYKYRRGEQWCPIWVTGAPTVGGGSEGYPIYHKSIGQLPGYSGHVPGNKLRVEKTFGNDTRDGKRWLRGDFSN